MLKWLVSITVLFLTSLIGWIFYIQLSGFGDWQPIPDQPPSAFHLYQSDLTDASQQAEAALRTHYADHDFPGITAAVGINGELAWTGAIGWADIEQEEPMSSSSVLRIGSTSKPLTATILARLVDQGAVDLDTPISQYGTWPNPVWNNLTLRQLSSHTAGMPGYETNSDWAGLYETLRGRTRYKSVYDSLDIFDDSDLLFEPGAGFSYSSFDVNLVGAVIASQQSTPYSAVLRKQVTEPLGLRHTWVAGTNSTELVSFYENEPGQARLWRPFDLSQRWPSGGLLSTSVELVEIGLAWLDESFISKTTRNSMWAPQVLADGNVNEQNYAVGWRFALDGKWPGDETRNLKYAHHGGVSKGAMSWLVVYPDVNMVVAVNINTRADTFAEFARVEKKITKAFLEYVQP